MKQQNESVKKLEVGKDYVNVHDNSVIVIDRVSDMINRGFEGEEYKNYLSCSNHSNWREATKEEVIEAFKRHLVYRYGKDWETMKIKEMNPHQGWGLNDGSWNVEISKEDDGWNVWNENGILYFNGIWVERLEEEEEPKKSTDCSPLLEAIREIKKELASETQIGGSHYSDMAIQPTEFIHKNNLSFIQGNIIKYVCRYKSKGGIEDLNKAKHYIDLLIEFEEE